MPSHCKILKLTGNQFTPYSVKKPHVGAFFIFNLQQFTIFVSNNWDMKIEDIATTLKNILRKQNTGTVPEQVIGDAILNAEKDLYNDGINLFRSKAYLHEGMKPFVTTENVTFTSGSVSKPTIKVLMDAQIKDGSSFWPAKIVESPAEFRVGTLLDAKKAAEENNIPMSLLTKTLSASAAETTLPDHFVEHLGAFNTVDGEEYQAIEIQPNMWGSRDKGAVFGEAGYSHLNVTEVTLASASFDADGKIALPAQFVMPLSIVTQSGGKKYQGILVSPDKYNSRNRADMLNDGEIKEQLTITKKTISLTSGIGDLPDTFILDKQMFQAGDYEGLILDSKEFLDRKNSVILPPETEYPIARIFGGKIEVAPDSITTIDIYAYEFPTDKQCVATVDGGELKVTPVPTSDVIFQYVKHPVAKRPVFKIENHKLVVDPAPTEFKLTYIEYPTEKCALIRNVDTTLEVKPSALTSAQVTYIADLTPAVYAVKVRADSKGYEFDSVNSTDTLFDIEYQPMIVAKACKYLGVPYKEEVVTSFEKI